MVFLLLFGLLLLIIAMEEYGLPSSPRLSEWFYRKHVVWRRTGHTVCLPS